jgi:uroporphyrinogen decarboxylase
VEEKSIVIFWFIVYFMITSMFLTCHFAIYIKVLRMTSRERIVSTLHHKTPDRVPIDLGGMDSTGAIAPAYRKLKQYLGLPDGDIKISTPMGQEVLVDDSVLRAVHADVKRLALGPQNWKKSTVSDGTPCLVPEKWEDTLESDGSRVVRDSEGRIIAKMPKGGYYFDKVFYPLAKCTSVHDLDQYQKYFDTADYPAYLDEEYSSFAERGKEMFEKTEYAIFGILGTHVFAMGQALRGWDQFLVDLISNPVLTDGILDKLMDVATDRFDKFNAAVGKFVHVINVNDDLGTQTGPFMSVDLYRKRIKPFHKKLFRYIKEHSTMHLFLHSDGSIAEFIPDLIDCGLDILNPVQFTARNMDINYLKKEYGQDLTFWGGGCDTQTTLPLGNPRTIKNEVKHQLDVLAKGGGYVFAQVHNIQEEVPAENVMAMYEAVWEWNEGK